MFLFCFHPCPSFSNFLHKFFKFDFRFNIRFLHFLYCCIDFIVFAICFCNLLFICSFVDKHSSESTLLLLLLLVVTSERSAKQMSFKVKHCDKVVAHFCGSSALAGVVIVNQKSQDFMNVFCGFANPVSRLFDVAKIM